MLENNLNPEPIDPQGRRDSLADTMKQMALKRLHGALERKRNRILFNIPEFHIPEGVAVSSESALEIEEIHQIDFFLTVLKVAEDAAFLTAAMLDTKTDPTQKSREICDTLKDIVQPLDHLGFMDPYRQADGYGIWGV